jgi:hypothetical protein
MPNYELPEIVIEKKKENPGEKYKPEKPTEPGTSVEELAKNITRVSVGQELRKSIESRYEEIRSMNPEELIPIYHGCRSGFKEAISNVLSYQGGVRQFKYYHTSKGDNNATFSLIPVSVYWSGIDDRGGLKMYVPRKELALPGESYDGKRVILLESPKDNDEKPMVNSDVGVVGMIGGSTDSYLSLLDLKGEIALGENSKVDKESAEKIIELNENFASLREHLKSPREKMISTLDKIHEGILDLPEANKLLDGHKYEVLTMPLVANRVLDRTISLTADALQKELQMIKQKKEQERDAGQLDLNKIQPNIDKLKDDLQAYQENQGLWARISRKKSKALQQLEQTCAEIAKEYPVASEPEATSNKKEELTSKAENLIKRLSERDLTLKDNNQKSEQEINKFNALIASLEELQKNNENFNIIYQEAIKSKD